MYVHTVKQVAVCCAILSQPPPSRSPGTTHSPSVLTIMTSTLAPRNRSLQGHPGAPAERQHRAPRPPKTHPAAADRSAGGHALPGSHAKAERGRSALHARITIARIAGGFVLPVGPGGSPGRVRSEATPRYMRGAVGHISRRSVFDVGLGGSPGRVRSGTAHCAVPLVLQFDATPVPSGSHGVGVAGASESGRRSLIRRFWTRSVT
jgi:hypothetical protein